MTKIIKMSVVVLLFMFSSANASVLFKDLPCNISVEGNGFFKVIEYPDEGPIKVFYMKNGILQVDQHTRLVNSDGHVFEGFFTDPYGQYTNTTCNVAMHIDGTVFSDLRIEPHAITEDGNIINGTYSSITGIYLVGTREYLFQFSLFDFTNPEGLREIREGIYQATVESGPPIQNYGSVSLTNGTGRLVLNSSVPIPSAIPTVSEWGMIIFFILLVGSTLWIYRRKQKQNPV